MKHVLLAVVGLSPQIVTETIYALRQEQKPLDEIRILTTTEGKKRIHAELLASGTGAFHRYLEEFEVPSSAMVFNPSHIHVPVDENGRDLSDIITEDDNEAFLRLCVEQVFILTSSADTTVYFSIAGGRKTMSSCLAAAVQMYGRFCDRMYHVLVSPEFERNSNFYYPPREPQIIELRDDRGEPVYKSTEFARVSLAHIPFYSIRERLSPEFLQTPMEPAELISSLIKDDSLFLVCDLNHCKLHFKNLECDLRPSLMALYAFFLGVKQKSTCCSGVCAGCNECFLSIAEILERRSEIADIYSRITTLNACSEMSSTGITSISEENFKSYKSKIRSRLQSAFGSYVLPKLEVSCIAQRPVSRYGVALPRKHLVLLD